MAVDFVALQTRVAEETGLSLSDSTELASIKAWINAAYQELSGFFNWPWLFTNFTIQSEADITTGTATVTAGSTSVTLSSGPAASVATYYMIQFTTASDDWYFISSHSAASTSLTLANAFNGTSNYTAGTYKIRRVMYLLPTNIDRLIDLRQARTDQKIELVDIRTFDKLLPDPTATGTPLYAMPVGMNSAGTWQLSFFPNPTAKINIQGRGYQKITELSSNTDEPLVPEKWRSVLVFLALAMFGHDFIDDTRVKTAQDRASAILKEMLLQYNPMPGHLTVIQPWDTRNPRPFMGARLPSNYPFPYGW